MSYHGCVCRWPHVAVCVAFFSIQMCGDVLSQMHTQATTCSNMCFYQYSNVYWCFIFVALHEANMCAVFPKSKCVEMLYLIAWHWVIIDAVFPAYNCVLMSYLVASHWSNHVCCFSSVQSCGDVISWCITLKQSCVMFFQSPNVVMSYLVVLHWVIIWCVVFSVHKCVVMPNLCCIALSNYMHCFSQCLNVCGFSYLVACTTLSNHGVCFHNVLYGCCIQGSCWSWFSSE